MFTKLALSASLLFIAAASAAHAGPTITDKRYWPNEVGPSAYRSSATQAMARSDSQWRSDRASVPRTKSCTYQGGPKSGMWACR
jgi:hypothetical protein